LRIISLFIISLLLFPSVKKFYVFADFQLNREAISNAFCENIQSDENCKGTCHLIKEIKKESAEKNKSPFTAIDHFKYELFFFSEKRTDNHLVFSKKPAFVFLPGSEFNIPLEGVFRPPQQA